MLFKRQRASVYGIDAYLVDVEVDVGSARTQDFNVVGLPDNAVKESRERIKSALRNSGFEFPHGQGVTINFGAGRCEERRLGLRFADGAWVGRLHGTFLRQAAESMHVSRGAFAGWK